MDRELVHGGLTLSLVGPEPRARKLWEKLGVASFFRFYMVFFRVLGFFGVRGQGPLRCPELGAEFLGELYSEVF